MSERVQILGKEKLIQNLKKWQFLKAQELERNDAETALRVARDAKRLAPVDTGRLRNAINSASTKDGWFVIADTNYATFVEFGTDRAPAQPFLNPALEQNRGAYFRRIKEIMRKRGF